MLPEDDAGADVPGEDQAQRVVLDRDQPWLEMQRVVRTDADIAARDAQGGKGHGVLRGSRVPQRDTTVAALAVGGPFIADRAEA